ncbi:hypothetical protein [Streptomyces sp. NPDC054765]
MASGGQRPCAGRELHPLVRSAERGEHAAPVTSPRSALADEATAPKLALYLGDRDVPDPWGKAPEDFAAVVALVEEGTVRHLP